MPGMNSGLDPDDPTLEAAFRSALLHQGLIAAEWGQSENNRRAKYYRLTEAGQLRLREETADWNRLAAAIAAALSAVPE